MGRYTVHLSICVQIKAHIHVHVHPCHFLLSHHPSEGLMRVNTVSLIATSALSKERYMYGICFLKCGKSVLRQMQEFKNRKMEGMEDEDLHVLVQY